MVGFHGGDHEVGRGAVDKWGSGLQLGQRKAQGPVNFYELILSDAGLQAEWRRVVDGEEILEGTVSEGERPAEEEAA